MKNLICFLMVLTLPVGGVHAQTVGPVRLSGLNLWTEGGMLGVKFSAFVPQGSVRRNHILIFAPVVTDGINSASFAAVTAHGRGGATAKLRHDWPSADEGRNIRQTVRSGSSVSYSERIPLEPWMNGASLKMESVTVGCCNYMRQEDIVLFPSLELWDEPLPQGTVEQGTADFKDIPDQASQPSINAAEELSINFPFIQPASRFDPSNPLRMDRNDRKNALVIYFRQGYSTVDPYYRTNGPVLDDLTGAIRRIIDDPHSDIYRVVIGGFTSPEGGTQINRRIAYDRAETIRDYIVGMTGIPRTDIILRNGEVDWDGLRIMVMESDLPERFEVARIIDQVPVWDHKAQKGRHGELMRLNGGSTYWRLRDEFFPLMRSGACIKVYYRDKQKEIPTVSCP